MLRSTVPKPLLGTSTFLVVCLLTASPQVLAIGGFDQKLDGRLTATWQGQQLGAILERLASTQEITIWLDRRVDPQQQINAQHSNATVREVLDRIVADHALGWTLLDEIIYVGPPESATDLATLAARSRQSLRGTPADYRNRWLVAEPTNWPRLSEPRGILTNWFENADIRLSNPQMLPHDLWNARSLPPMKLADRVVLLLLGYDMTCEIAPNGRSCRIIPIKRPVLITEKHNAGDKSREVIAAFQNEENVKIHRNGRQLTVTGRWEDQQRVAEIIAESDWRRPPPQNQATRASKQRFSLKLENQPVGKVVDQLAAQLGLKVVWKQQLLSGNTDLRQTQVSCEVINADLNKLLENVLTPAGLSFRLNGNQLEIVPATP
jgi:hypothetical protein